MKIALVHDFLLDKGGAEKVLEAIYEIFPSPVFTLMSRGTHLYKKIQTSGFNHFIFQKFHRFLLPLYPKAIESFDLREYNCIISSSHSFAKNVLTNSQQLHICYCHSPMRSIHDLYFEHLGFLKGIKKRIFKQVSHNVRFWDLVSCNRVDLFIANSKFVAKRIEKTYGRVVEKVIYPPVDVEDYEGLTQKEDFFIVISRLVPYKRIDLIVEAFKRNQSMRLIIIGAGSELKKLKNKKVKNIEFLGYQPRTKCIEYLKKAKGFIHMAVEDFGISMVEALAAGTPVIALGEGGSKEIIQEGITGIFVKQQSVDALLDSLDQFMKKNFDYAFIQNSALNFSKKRFQNEMKEFVEKKCAEFFS